MNSLFFTILKKPILGRSIAKMISRITGGEMKSRFLREYTKEVYKVDVGMYTYGSCFRSNFCAGGGVKIGRYCSLANNVFYIGFDHIMDIVSTSPIFFESYYLNKYGINVDDTNKYHTLEIGNDVWIGMNVTILSKCHKIGNGAIIGAGSIVCNDIPPYAIVAGNPAKLIRYRFDDATIDYLNESKWWEKEPDELMEIYDSFMLNPRVGSRKLKCN